MWNVPTVVIFSKTVNYAHKNIHVQHVYEVSRILKIPYNISYVVHS